MKELIQLLSAQSEFRFMVYIIFLFSTFVLAFTTLEKIVDHICSIFRVKVATIQFSSDKLKEQMEEREQIIYKRKEDESDKPAN